MADNKNFWDDNEDPFDGEFDPSVFGDDDSDPINYADDDFIDYFDEDIVASEIEKRNKMYSEGKDDYDDFGGTKFYGDTGGRSAFDGIKDGSDLEETKILSDISDGHGKHEGKTKKPSFIESIQQKMQQRKAAAAEKAGAGGDEGQKGEKGTGGGFSVFLNKLKAPA